MEPPCSADKCRGQFQGFPFDACLPTFLPAFLPTCLLTAGSLGLLACLPACLLGNPKMNDEYKAASTKHTKGIPPPPRMWICLHRFNPFALTTDVNANSTQHNNRQPVQSVG